MRNTITENKLRSAARALLQEIPAGAVHARQVLSYFDNDDPVDPAVDRSKADAIRAAKIFFSVLVTLNKPMTGNDDDITRYDKDKRREEHAINFMLQNHDIRWALYKTPFAHNGETMWIEGEAADLILQHSNLSWKIYRTLPPPSWDSKGFVRYYGTTTTEGRSYHTIRKEWRYYAIPKILIRFVSFSPESPDEIAYYSKILEEMACCYHAELSPCSPTNKTGSEFLLNLCRPYFDVISRLLCYPLTISDKNFGILVEDTYFFEQLLMAAPHFHFTAQQLQGLFERAVSKSAWNLIKQYLLPVFLMREENRAIFSELLRKITIEGYLKTPIQHAADHGQWDVIVAIAEQHETGEGDTLKLGYALLLMSRNAMWKECAILLKQKHIRLDFYNPCTGWTALDYVIAGKQDALVAMIKARHPDCALKNTELLVPDDVKHIYELALAGNAHELQAMLCDHPDKTAYFVNYAAYGAAMGNHTALLAYLVDEGADEKFIHAGKMKSIVTPKAVPPSTVAAPGTVFHHAPRTRGNTQPDGSLNETRNIF